RATAENPPGPDRGIWAACCSIGPRYQGSVSIVTSQRTSDSRSALKLVRCGLTTVTSPHTRSGVMIAAGAWFATLKTQHPAPRLRSPDVSSFRLFGPD